MNTTWAIQTDDLTRTFGDTDAVRGIDLRVPPATVFGLLGPNGAGKTTTVRMLTTRLPPTGGTARVMGLDVRTHAPQIRTLIGVTAQEAGLDEELPGTSALTLLARLNGHRRAAARDRVERLLEVFDLTDAAHRPVHTYSGGMRRRLDIAASLLGSPRLLFLDEPTTGLDPRSREQVWDLVRTMAHQGTTVLLTTQYLTEADRLADRIAVIDRGRLLTQGTPRDLRTAHGHPRLRLHLTRPEQHEQARRALAPHTAHLDTDTDGALTATATGPHGTARTGADLLTALDRAHVQVDRLTLEPPTLDEVFLSLTERNPAA